MEPQRISGFSKFATAWITANPGATANDAYEAAKFHFDREGIPLSAADDPRSSLVCTLHKYYRKYGLSRVKGRDGRYRYYPSGAEPRADGESMNTNKTNMEQEVAQEAGADPENQMRIDLSNRSGCCVKLSVDDCAKVQALVTLGKYADEHAAHQDLVKRGLESVLATL